MKVLDIQQGTPEWLASRAGKVTASRIVDVLAKIKTGEAACRKDYKTQLVAEILTGRPQGDSFVSADMAYGTETEPLARAAYEVRHCTFVDQVGFVLHPTIERAGASPDGLVNDGLIEIKCPKASTHLSYLMCGTVPAKYQPQMFWQMACCERDWCDFVSFRPDFPDDLQLYVARLERDDERIKEIEAEVLCFLDEVDEIVQRLTRKAA